MPPFYFKKWPAFPPYSWGCSCSLFRSLHLLRLSFPPFGQVGYAGICCVSLSVTGATPLPASYRPLGRAGKAAKLCGKSLSGFIARLKKYSVKNGHTCRDVRGGLTAAQSGLQRKATAYGRGPPLTQNALRKPFQGLASCHGKCGRFHFIKARSETLQAFSF